MYRNRLTIFAAIATVILLAIPAANLASSAYIGAPLLPRETRDLWSVDRVEGNLAYLFMSCCNRSIYPERVRIGRNGYFFLGNDDGRVIDKTAGLWHPPAEKLEELVKRFGRLQHEVAEAGAALAIVIAPNKHSVYPEMLPKDLTPARQTVTDDVLGRADAVGVGLPMLDLRADMRRLKTTAQAYLKTDTHWTNAGAADSYDRIMEFLRDQQGVAASTIGYNLIPTRRPAGDLVRLLKMREMFGQDHEADYRIELTMRPDTCVATISMISGETSECAPSGNDEVSVMDKSMKVTRTINAPNDQTVLMLCDSFCTRSSSLFNATFRTVYRVHWKFLDRKTLSRHIETLAPDIVILQMVERDMLTFGDGEN